MTDCPALPKLKLESISVKFYPMGLSHRLVREVSNGFGSHESH